MGRSGFESTCVPIASRRRRPRPTWYGGICGGDSPTGSARSYRL